MRIISLLASATETLFALGVGQQVLAVSHECDYPPETVTLPRATRSLVDSSRPSAAIDEQVKSWAASGAALYDIDRALLRELRPDLIVTQAQCDVCAVRYADVVDFIKSEPALRHTQVLGLNPNSLDDVLNDVLHVGATCGVRLAAERYVAELNGRLEAVARRAASLVDREPPTVVILEWLDPLMTAGNWTPQLVETAGGRALLAEAGRHSEYVAWDDVVAADPDVLIACPCGFGLQRTLVEVEPLCRRPEWPKLQAVQNGCAFALDGNAYLNRSGPRLVDTLELLAHWLGPESGPPPGGEPAEGRAWRRLPR
jgi:iron complex transport system substrate-binding protein